MKLFWLLPTAVAGVATTLWSVYSHSLSIGIVIGLAWIVAAFLPVKTKISMPVFAATLVVLTTVISLYNLDLIKTPAIFDKEALAQEATKQDATPNPEGTIVVEAGTGTLTNKGSYSYIAESARGLEAYLGDKLATASYKVDVTEGKTYVLWVKLVDDGLFKNGDRSVDIYVNNTDKLQYKHVSEDTKGWKWFNIGTVTLKSGQNTIDFVKPLDTYAAYTMDEFKLVPAK